MQYPEENIWPKRDENFEWRRLHNEEFHILYCTSNIVRMIKFKGLRWAGKKVRVLSNF